MSGVRGVLDYAGCFAEAVGSWFADGGMSSTTLPEVDDYLLHFVDIEREIIVVTPVHQILYLFPVLCLVID